jgi:sodium/bile acid cotransporter 7
MVLTPILLAVVVSGGAQFGAVASQVGGVFAKLLLPFIVGQACRGIIAGFLQRHNPIVGKADRAVIVLIVYVAFCDAALAGMWTSRNAAAIIIVGVLCCLLLAFALLFTTWASRALKLPVEDEIAAVFCGSKKSLANGAPIGKVLFGASPALSLILVPLLLYHQIQLLVCAVLARRYCARR